MLYRCVWIYNWQWYILIRWYDANQTIKVLIRRIYRVDAPYRWCFQTCICPTLTSSRSTPHLLETYFILTVAFGCSTSRSAVSIGSRLCRLTWNNLSSAHRLRSYDYRSLLCRSSLCPWKLHSSHEPRPAWSDRYLPLSVCTPHFCPWSIAAPCQDQLVAGLLRAHRSVPKSKV